MPRLEEPSYLFFAREAIKRGEGVSNTILKELVARIDRDSEKLESK